MSQVMQMTRHVTSWLGWTPASPCDGLPAEEEEEPLQESSGFITVLILYLGMAGLFAALNLCTSSAKRELAALEPRQVQVRLGRHGRSTTGSSLRPSWLVNLTTLIREVAAPRRPHILLQQQQQQQRLRMRLLRQKEQELEMESEWQEHPTWQDVFDEEEPVATTCFMPNRQKSTYFDLPSDSE